MEQTPQTTTHREKQAGAGLSIRRRFTTPGLHPFDAIEWELRDARIGHGEKLAFEQRDVEFPTGWSQNATNIVAQKYFRGQPGSPERERSVKQMIARVAGTIASWGRERGYFASVEDGDTFEAELTHILLHQMAAFNSPVWFNVGWHPVGSPKMQASACFILSVEDNMESILEWNTKEGIIFRGGLGLGDQSLEDPWLDGATQPRRDRFGTGELHARRGRLGGLDQVRRRHASRGQDGRTRRRPSRHPRVHLVQGARGGQGGRAARRRFRHVASMATASSRSSTRTPITPSA